MSGRDRGSRNASGARNGSTGDPPDDATGGESGEIPPLGPGGLERFRETFLYEPPAFLVDRVLEVDRSDRRLVARMDTTRELPIARYQRVRPGHPAHVSGAELVMATGSLGCLHAWCFHGCEWEEGWVGYGNRIHRADFHSLARVGPPLDLVSRETRIRAREQRLVLRFSFDFRQDGRRVYTGDQSAMFLREPDLT